MNNYDTSLKTQNAVFTIVTAITVIFSIFSLHMESDRLLLPLCAVIVLLGVPHGSFDSFYAQTSLGLKSVSSWVSFVAGYLLLAGLVILTWMLLPSLFFVAFLLISALHFAEDLDQEGSSLVRFIYGSSIIVLPFCLHSVAVGEIFSFLIPKSSALLFQNFLFPLSWVWLAGSAYSAFLCFKRSSMNGFAVVSVALLALFAQPLIAFAIYFCVMHSPRHILRTFQLSQQFSQTNILLLGLFPTLFVFLAFIFFESDVQKMDYRAHTAQIVFVGLAALTVPHVLLLARAAKKRSMLKTTPPELIRV